MSTPDNDTFITPDPERGLAYSQKDILLTKALETSCKRLKDFPDIRGELLRNLISGKVKDIESEFEINDLLVDRRFRQSLWEIEWVSAFGEHVPHDFEELAVSKKPLSDATIISAALIHPNWIVANECCTKVKTH